MSQNYTDLNKNRSTKETSSDQIKRTDVNILLNRVRLDQKRTLQRRIIFSLFLVSILSLLSAYFIL